MNPLRRRIQTAMQSGGGAAAWNPASIAGLQLWLDASQITGLNDGDAVATWTDASGNGWHATQSTASARPTFQTGEINGKPVVRFDGVDDSILNATFAVSQPCTWFVVVKTTGGHGVNRFILDAVGAATDRQCLIYFPSTTKWNLYANLFFEESGTTGATFKSIQAVFNGASSQIVVGGTTTTGNPGSSNLANGYRIGNAYGGTAFHFGGDIAEMGCYNSVLSGANLSALQSYLNAKYGL